MADRGVAGGSAGSSAGSRTLGRGLSVLQRLAENPEGATVAQLATATELDRAVLYRLLQTLVDEGFAVRDPDTRKFHLGATTIELGIKATRALRIRRLALPGMRALMEQAREAICMAVRDRSDAVVVDRVEPRGLSVRVGYHVGHRHPLTKGAHGLALLAFLDEEEQESVEGMTPEVRAELQTVKSRGFATSTDDLERGAAGVAAPVLGPTGRPIGSIGVVAPSLRLREPAVLGPRVRALTLEISRRLNQSSDSR